MPTTHSPAADPPRTLLVLSSRTGTCRRDLLTHTRDKGIRVVLAANRATWEHEYCDAFRQVAIHDYEHFDEVVAALADFAREQAAEGILTTDDFAGPVLAEVAQILGLRAAPPGLAADLRDKSAMRRRFAEAQLPSAASAFAHSIEQARAALERIGLPVVVKPASGTGGAGVMLVRNAQDLAEAFNTALTCARENYAADGVLVEEYLDGMEVCAEAVVYEGEVLFQAVSDSPMAESADGFGDYELVTPSALPDQIVEEIHDVHRRLLRALGLDFVVAHTQMRVTDRGPRLLEIHARPAGQRVPQIIEEAHGVDIMGAAAQTAVGIRPTIEPRANGYACYRAVTPVKPGVLRSLRGIERAAAMPGIFRIEQVAGTGTYLPAMPRYEQEDIAYVYAHADTYEQGRRRADAAVRLIEFVVD